MPKVGWVYAGRIIASVAKDCAFRYLSDKLFIKIAMSRQPAIVYLQMAIAALQSETLPKPASCSGINLITAKRRDAVPFGVEIDFAHMCIVQSTSIV